MLIDAFGVTTERTLYYSHYCLRWYLCSCLCKQTCSTFQKRSEQDASGVINIKCTPVSSGMHGGQLSIWCSPKASPQAFQTFLVGPDGFVRFWISVGWITGGEASPWTRTNRELQKSCEQRGSAFYMCLRLCLKNIIYKHNLKMYWLFLFHSQRYRLNHFQHFHSFFDK